MPSPRSRVEVGPTVAHRYDFFMNVILLGYYPRLIKKVVDKMDIQPEQSILDLGSGTGRNDCLMARKIGPEGHILGLDLKEMLSSQGFTSFEEELFLGKHLRLLKATK